MPNRVFATTALAAALFAPAAWGQEAPAPAAPLAAATEAPAPPRAVAGQQVILEIAEPISSKTHKRGDFFAIRLAAPIAVGDVVVVPAGAAGKGQVVDAAPAGPLGRPAKLLLAARYLEIDGVQVTLHGLHMGAAGKDNTNAIEGLSFVPYLGVFAGFMKGGEIVIPAGALGAAKLGADVSARPPAAAAPADIPTPASK
jgi:hypothetical protein